MSRSASTTRTAAALFAGLLIGSLAMAQGQGQLKAAPGTKAVPSGPLSNPNADALVRITCKGPLKYTLNRVPERARPMLFDVTLDFKGASDANLKPGQCWREGGWGSGQSLSSAGDGQLIYRVDLGTCPFVDKLVIERGRITDYKVNDQFVGGSWFDSATKAEGNSFMVEAKWLGPPQRSSLPAVYAVDVPAGARTRASGCG